MFKFGVKESAEKIWFTFGLKILISQNKAQVYILIPENLSRISRETKKLNFDYLYFD